MRISLNFKSEKGKWQGTFACMEKALDVVYLKFVLFYKDVFYTDTLKEKNYTDG
jgi:hypothetical protein